MALVYKAIYHMSLLPHMLFSEVDNETYMYDVEAVSQDRHRENDMKVPKGAKCLDLTYSLQIHQKNMFLAKSMVIAKQDIVCVLKGGIIHNHVAHGHKHQRAA